MTARFSFSCLAVSLACITLASSVANAQRATSDQRSYSERNIAGDFDYYSLVLSWSPTHCSSPQGQRDHSQCRPNRERGFAFVLHGLWPQYERGYPERCRTRFKPFVPRKTISSMMDIMPSKGLIIHEYRKHGTCSGLTPEAYYDLSRKLFDKIQIPAAFEAPRSEQFMSPRDLIADFRKANPGLRSDMMSVVCRGSGNRLREIRFCFSRSGQLRSCGRNENQRRLCSAKRMFIPPVRYSRR